MTHVVVAYKGWFHPNYFYQLAKTSIGNTQFNTLVVSCYSMGKWFQEAIGM